METGRGIKIIISYMAYLRDPIFRSRWDPEPEFINTNDIVSVMNSDKEGTFVYYNRDESKRKAGE